MNYIKTVLSHFNIYTDVSDVIFRKCHVEPYDTSTSQKFGEERCLLYQVEALIYNVPLFIRILTFKYDKSSEILKLEITSTNEQFSKEVVSCRNFLQRKRNLNLTFEVLIKFTRLYEVRRLICDTVFNKIATISTESGSNGIVVKLKSKTDVSYLEFNWVILWKVKDCYEIGDFIEFFINRNVLDKRTGDLVQAKLNILVLPDISFQIKLRLWKALIEDLYGIGALIKKLSSDSIVEIEDSDNDSI